jgi:hypothetical protein
MFKRFVIGFIIGVLVMYWYIHRSAQTVAGVSGWIERSASEYRGDRDHEAIDQQTQGRP